MSDAEIYPGGRPLPPIGREGVRLLEDVPFFSHLSRRTLRRLAKVAQQVAYTPGSIVVAAGTPGGAAFFVVFDGEASVRRGSHELARVYRGDFFGELSLLDGRRRAATVVATTDLTVIRLTRDAFRDLVASDVDLAFHVLEVLGQRIRDLEDELDRLRGAGEPS
jgi:CRP-like cAMP-binding protein